MSAIIEAGKIEDEAKSHGPISNEASREIDKLLKAFVEAYAYPAARGMNYNPTMAVDHPLIKYLQFKREPDKRIDVFVKPGVVYVFYVVGDSIIKGRTTAYERRVDLQKPERSLKDAIRIYEELIYPYVKKFGTSLDREFLDRLEES